MKSFRQYSEQKVNFLSESIRDHMTPRSTEDISKKINSLSDSKLTTYTNTLILQRDIDSLLVILKNMDLSKLDEYYLKDLVHTAIGTGNLTIVNLLLNNKLSQKSLKDLHEYASKAGVYVIAKSIEQLIEVNESTINEDTRYKESGCFVIEVNSRDDNRVIIDRLKTLEHRGIKFDYNNLMDELTLFPNWLNADVSYNGHSVYLNFWSDNDMQDNYERVLGWMRRDPGADQHLYKIHELNMFITNVKSYFGIMDEPSYVPRRIVRTLEGVRDHMTPKPWEDIKGRIMGIINFINVFVKENGKSVTISRMKGESPIVSWDGSVEHRVETLYVDQVEIVVWDEYDEEVGNYYMYYNKLDPMVLTNIENEIKIFRKNSMNESVRTKMTGKVDKMGEYKETVKYLIEQLTELFNVSVTYYDDGDSYIIFIEKWVEEDELQAWFKENTTYRFKTLTQLKGNKTMIEVYKNNLLESVRAKMTPKSTADIIKSFKDNATYKDLKKIELQLKDKLGDRVTTTFGLSNTERGPRGYKKYQPVLHINPDDKTNHMQITIGGDYELGYGWIVWWNMGSESFPAWNVEGIVKRCVWWLTRNDRTNESVRDKMTPVSQKDIDKMLSGMTPNEKLTRGAEEGLPWMVKNALDSGADVHHLNDLALNLVCDHRETHMLIDDRLEIVKLLMDAGANMHAMGSLAVRNCPLEIEQLLRQYKDYDFDNPYKYNESVRAKMTPKSKDDIIDNVVKKILNKYTEDTVCFTSNEYNGVPSVMTGIATDTMDKVMKFGNGIYVSFMNNGYREALKEYLWKKNVSFSQVTATEIRINSHDKIQIVIKKMAGDVMDNKSGIGLFVVRKFTNLMR